jgi:hypothetical protein
VLTILSMSSNEVGSYSVIVTNLYGTVTSSNAIISLAQKSLVGRWFNGSASLADVSGYTPAGTHDGSSVGAGAGSEVFTNDVPPSKTGQSLFLPTEDVAIAIQNSSTVDGAYTNTFDDTIRGHMTVTLWAKGIRPNDSWRPWVSKWGEGGTGWQLRTGNGGAVLNPCWTVRDGGVGAFALGCGPTWAPAGDLDDLHAATSGAGATADANRVAIDGNWHFYAGTYNAVSGVQNLYVDGLLRGQETNNALYNLAADSAVVIGARNNPGTANYEAFSIQQIYDVRIYNYDLTAAEVFAFMPGGGNPGFSGPPVLNGNMLVLTWTNGTLLSATNLLGPWTPVGATSPYTNNVTTAPQRFFRVVNP